METFIDRYIDKLKLLAFEDVHTIDIFEVVAEARAQKDNHDVRSLLFALYYCTSTYMHIYVFIELVVDQGGAMYLVFPS